MDIRYCTHPQLGDGVKTIDFQHPAFAAFIASPGFVETDKDGTPILSAATSVEAVTDVGVEEEPEAARPRRTRAR